MSILVSDSGMCRVYVVVDTSTRTILDAFNGFGNADADATARLRVGAANLAIYNVTHRECPDWVREFAESDPEYCNARAAFFEKSADAMRQKLTALTAEMKATERTAAQWRERAETIAPRGPKA